MKKIEYHSLRKKLVICFITLIAMMLLAGYPVKVSAATTIGTPKITSVSTTKDGQPNVKWSKVKGAKGYCLYRKTPTDKKWILVKDTSKLSFTDKNWVAVENSTVKYMVKAYVEKNQKRTYSSASKAKSWIVPMWRYTEVTRGTEYRATYSYDNEGRVISYSVTSTWSLGDFSDEYGDADAGYGEEHSSGSYTYDENGYLIACSSSGYSYVGGHYSNDGGINETYTYTFVDDDYYYYTVKSNTNVDAWGEEVEGGFDDEETGVTYYVYTDRLADGGKIVTKVRDDGQYIGWQEYNSKNQMVHSWTLLTDTFYTYNARGQVIKKVRGEEVTTYKYDKKARLIEESVVDSRSSRTITYSYSKEGYLVKKNYSSDSGSYEELYAGHILIAKQ